MSREILSYVMALVVMLGVFGGVHLMRGNDGQAMASSSGLPARAMVGDLEMSSAQKRDIRKAVLSNRENILTLTGADVRAIFNQPELVRRDLPTVIWQYRNESCVLDVYFTTTDAKATNAPVAYYEVRARQVGVEDEAVQGGCVDQLVRANSGGVQLVNLDAFYK